MSRAIWLIRHGETEWSRSGAHTGRTDLPLTDAGRENAVAVGRWMAGHSFSLVLTSPLSRARDTCRLAGFGDAAQVDPNLCEWDYGDYEGRTTADIRQESPDWSLWTAGPLHGETVEQVSVRAEAVLARILREEGDVALFAHGHILRILTARWLGLPPDCGRLFALATGSVSVLGYERETHVIAQWNVPVPGGATGPTNA
jgi:probable phosphoglycerate mutase